MTTRKRWKSLISRRATATSAPFERARRKFRRFFPKAFTDPTYLDWERDYKWETHQRWNAVLGRREYERLLAAHDFRAIATAALRVEQRSRHSMVFSFEKMALRDAVRSPEGAKAFAEGLYALLHGDGALDQRFERWVDTVAGLPRRQTRVLTWPIVTVFGFIAQPDVHMFVKPLVMRRGAAACAYPLPYSSRPGWEVYSGVLGFAAQVRREVAAWKPRDMIDIQSFIWVQGSDEYD